MSGYSINNEEISICIAKKGAELTSLVDKISGREYMWQALEQFWSRHAPVLFPFVGKLRNNTYTHKGQMFSMGQHGFARDMDFEIQSQTDIAITFELKSSPETRDRYPFDFTLIISYALVGRSVEVSYQVINESDDQEMLFSIGAHPAFNCPIFDGTTREDYYLKLNVKEQPDAHLLEDGNFNGNTKQVFDKPGIINLDKSLFDQDAIVFKKFRSTSLSIVSKSTDHSYITVDFKGFPYLGIWSKSQESQFICIEPWYGLADNADHAGELRKKEGIQTLAAHESFNCKYTVSIH